MPIFVTLVAIVDVKKHINRKYHGKWSTTVEAADNVRWSFDLVEDRDGNIELLSPHMANIDKIKTIKRLEFEFGPHGSNSWAVFRIKRGISCGNEPFAVEEFLQIVTNIKHRLVAKMAKRYIHIQPTPRKLPLVTPLGIRQLQINRMYASIPAIVRDFNKKQRHINVVAATIGFSMTAFGKKVLGSTAAYEEEEKEEKLEVEELIKRYENLSWETTDKGQSSFYSPARAVGNEFSKLSLK